MARLPPVAGGGAAPVRAGAAGPARPRLALPGAPPRGSHAPQPDQASGAAADAPAAPPQAAAAPAAARSGCDGAGAGAPGADDCGAACHGSAVIADGPSCAGATHELCPAAHPCSLSHGRGPGPQAASGHLLRGRSAAPPACARSQASESAADVVEVTSGRKGICQPCDQRYMARAGPSGSAAAAAGPSAGTGPYGAGAPCAAAAECCDPGPSRAPGAVAGDARGGEYGRATLVICPLVAVIQWGQEIERFVAPNTLKVCAPPRRADPPPLGRHTARPSRHGLNVVVAPREGT